MYATCSFTPPAGVEVVSSVSQARLLIKEAEVLTGNPGRAFFWAFREVCLLQHENGLFTLRDITTHEERVLEDSDLDRILASTPVFTETVQ